MRRVLNRFYGHFVWATWDRMPLLTPEIREQVYAAIQTKCDELRCRVYAVGGTENHIHLVVELAGPVSQAALMQEVKGASSHLVTHSLAPSTFFKMAGRIRFLQLLPKRFAQDH
jgi:REP element-mobilizing transposase RayT